MPKTLDQIRSESLDALRQKLGKAGMIRFLQQFDNGQGNYVEDRREWLDDTSLPDLTKAVRKRQAGRSQKRK